MKNPRAIIALSLLVFATSCQTRVVDKLKPMQKNSLELYQKYTITTNEPKLVKMEVLKVDDDKIYGKTSNGQEVNINKSDVRTIKKTDWISSIAIGAAAILAVIFVPI
ncbi:MULTISPECIES: bacteriophage spanin2 family protein [Chryseobacterium]|uniref:bacteriophage spanin2 family protein n=1 Tax=Chryseobacterium sp. R2A-55 TaxID=2744445 RepID=UPI001F3F81F5|nr:bacteriophage spanin2 family protein [Chryseobacterium sp. R2A-55]